jgi:hypothetical protein
MTLHAAFEGPLPEGWQGGAPVTKHWNKEFIHLYRVTRPCASCTAEISIDVTRKALQGFSKNAGLLLRNCPKCRAERKAGGPGSRGGSSRPTATPVEPVPFAAGDELDKLRMMVTTMKAELEPLYAYNKELFAELQVAKARLALYELQPAMERTASIPADPTGQQLAREFAAKNKMPWE